MHEKEVTQTEIHKGQIEWDRISAHSSFLHGKAPLWKKTNQLTHSHSNFKPALLQSYRMDFKSGPLQLTSVFSVCTRHHPSYHNKHTDQLLTF